MSSVTWSDNTLSLIDNDIGDTEFLIVKCVL